MNEEIKEILEDFKEHLDKYEERFKKGAVDSTVYEIYCDDLRLLLDYITNLQQENENLKEDNWAYHQLLRAGNKREYRSKFLKDFQKEYGENVFPDYDEIYKRYDDYKSRFEKAIKLLEKGIFILPEDVNRVIKTLNGDEK